MPFKSLCWRNCCVLLPPIALLGVAAVIFVSYTNNKPSNISHHMRSFRRGSVFSISAFRQHWENSSSPASCHRSTYSLRALHECVRHSKQWSHFHKPVKIVLVGDSRLGVLRRHSAALFGFEKRGSCSDVNLGDIDPNLKCVFVIKGIHGEDENVGRKFHLTMTEGDNHFEIQSFWQVYLDTSFRAKLNDLTAICRRSRVDCPALVLANSGMWYARRFDLTVNASAADWILKYRNDLLDTRDAIQNLARYTTVVWKLEESELGSRHHKNFSILTPSVSVLHTYAYSVLHDIPNVVIWSSLLPTALEFYHRVCLVAYRSQEVLPYNLLVKECGDVYHYGLSVVSHYIQTVVDQVCSRFSTGPNYDRGCGDH